jgi:hypothetical protein
MEIAHWFNRPPILICFVLLLSFHSFGASNEDSLMNIKKREKGDFIVTTRLHSVSHFPFSGSYINRHLNVDLNLFYERNRIGAFLFKAQDLEDKHGIVNYFQPGIFKRFPAGKNLTFTVFGGYLFNQTAGFSDKDSDVWTALGTTWNISNHFKIENTALFFNVTKTELNSQWANRTVISAIYRDFKFDLYIWHNIVFKTNFQFTSAALALNFPKIHLSDKIKIQNSFSYQSYLSENKPSWAMRHGFLFSIAVPIQISSAG